MALANQPRNSLNDENSRPAVKLQGHGSLGTGRSGLKPHQHQSTTSERRILSDISNTKPLSSFGTPKPSPKPGLSVFRSENLPPKVAGQQPPQASSQKPSSRVPLRNIVNSAQPAPSSSATASAREVKQQSSQKRKSDYRFRLTPEELRQAEEWAKEDLPIELTHFTAHDMDAWNDRMLDEQIEESISRVRNYRATPLPSIERLTIKDVDSIYHEDGRLKPDLHCHSFDIDTYLPMDYGVSVAFEPTFVMPHISEPISVMPLIIEPSSVLAPISDTYQFDYHSVPEDWHVA